MGFINKYKHIKFEKHRELFNDNTTYENLVQQWAMWDEAFNNFREELICGIEDSA
jgi:hypothetical protein